MAKNVNKINEQTKRHIRKTKWDDVSEKFAPLGCGKVPTSNTLNVAASILARTLAVFYCLTFHSLKTENGRESRTIAEKKKPGLLQILVGSTQFKPAPP